MEMSTAANEKVHKANKSGLEKCLCKRLFYQLALNYKASDVDTGEREKETSG